MLNLKPAKKGECLANPDYFNLFCSCAGWAGWKCRNVVKVAILLEWPVSCGLPKGSPKVIFETETNCLIKCVGVLSDNALSHNIAFHLYLLRVSWLEKCNPFFRMVICLKSKKQSLETNPSSSYQLDDRFFPWAVYIERWRWIVKPNIWEHETLRHDFLEWLQCLSGSGKRWAWDQITFEPRQQRVIPRYWNVPKAWDQWLVTGLWT